MLDETLDFIARRVQMLRDERGLSARDMSLSIGQNPGYINKIETKQAKPSIAGLILICEYFNISMTDFFDEKAEHPAKINELLAAVKSLAPDSLDLLIGMAQKMSGGKKK
jgi:transcriptional regulator with XRE-family HTH domain